MAVKTITIDVESYALLARRKKPGQSFSHVIKEHFGRQPTVRDFLAGVRASHLSEEALRAGAEMSRRPLKEHEELDRLLGI